jgi:iron(III) transport system substrate-binding protein
LTLYSYLPEQQRRAGAPVGWLALAPTIAGTDGVGIAARAPHPQAARLFYDFMLGDGQALMAEMGHVVSRRGMAPELERLRLEFIDPAAVIEDYDRWTKIFEDTIYNRP